MNPHSEKSFPGYKANSSIFYNLLICLRPLQWFKNSFIFIPLIFAKRVFYYQDLLRTIAGVIIFSIIASAFYLMNDIQDLESDARHPQKKFRPLAAGLITIKLAGVVMIILLLFSLLLGYFLNMDFFFVLLCYAIIQSLYNFYLKRVVILDAFCISAGFFLRIVAGAVIIQVQISYWLIICSVLISMFLALSKRRQELIFLGKSQAHNHRKTLSEYTPYLLDQMIAVITASTLLSYMLYCISQETIEKFKTGHLIYTFPFVLYGLFRYLYLLHTTNKGGAPEKVLFSDIPLLVSVILWAAVCMLIIYKIV